MSRRLHDVSATTSDPVQFPVVVDRLVDAGCRVLGRIADDPHRIELDPRLAEVFAPETVASARQEVERPAAVALRAPGCDAFLVVDSVEGKVEVRARTMMTDGYLVETVAGSSEAHEATRRAERRSVRRVEASFDILVAHRAHVENHRLTHPGQPLAHERLDVLLDVWQWAADHDELVDRTFDHARLTAGARVSQAGLILIPLVGAAVSALNHELLLVVIGMALALVAAPLVHRGLVLRATRPPRRRPAFVARLTPDHRG